MNEKLQDYILSLEVEQPDTDNLDFDFKNMDMEKLQIYINDPEAQEIFADPNQNRSDVDWEVTKTLLELEYTDAEIAYVLMKRPNSKGREKGRSYVERTILKAKAELETETVEETAKGFLAEMKKNEGLGRGAENRIETAGEMTAGEIIEEIRAGITDEEVAKKVKDLEGAIDNIPEQVQAALYPLRATQKYELFVAYNEDGARIFSKQHEKLKDSDGKVVKDEKGKVEWVEKVKDLGFVITKPIEIQELWSIDDKRWWRIDGIPHLNRKAGILKFLDEEQNRIRQGKEAKDVLSVILGERSPPCQTGYATSGIYEKEDGTLEAALAPLTPKPSQRRMHDPLDFYTREFTKEELQDYIGVQKYFHPYEILPAMGLALTAQFALLFRTAGIHVPHLWHWNAMSDLGKTLIMWIMSRRLFGIPFDVQGSNLNTPNNYKLIYSVDSIGNLITVEEAAFIHLALFQDLKAFSNNRIAGERGLQEGGGAATLYLARAILGMTTNVPPPGEPTTLKRILVVRFDETQKAKRTAKSAELDRIYERLQPIGCGMINVILEIFKQRPLQEWINVIFDLKEKISAAYNDWQSVERPEMWATVYFGLMLWELVCREKGVDWKAPDIETFVKQVVVPIESSTWELKQDHFQTYMNAVSRWKAKNLIRVLVRKTTEEVKIEGQVFDAEKDREVYQEETRGSGELWLAKVEDWEDKRIPGVFHSKAMLDEINDVMHIPMESQMRVLRELGVQVAADSGFPIEFIAGADERGRRVRFRKGEKPKRAIFIPYAQ